MVESNNCGGSIRQQVQQTMHKLFDVVSKRMQNNLYENAGLSTTLLHRRERLAPGYWVEFLHQWRANCRWEFELKLKPHRFPCI